MVWSCLVEPLVQPLVGRRTGLSGSALQKSRLAATALACTALMAIAGTAEAAELAARAKTRSVEPARAEASVRNAHAKPAPIPYRELLQTVFAARREDDQLEEPGLAPSFEQDALNAHRLKHKRDIARDQSPGLGLGLRIDRLRGGLLATFLRFGSGRHLAGLPISA
ncbi:hypothetical protein L6R52_33790 [Myxococcota bacterium]|nr:hypothetical protein [Myxococcota bacterium]